MKLKLTLRRPSGDEVDLMVVVDATVMVGTLAEHIARRDPAQGDAPTDVTFQVEREHEWHLVPHGSTMAESGLRPGQVVELVSRKRADGDGTYSDVVGVLDVLSGPEAGERFPLVRGANLVGRARDNDVRLADPLVSKRHARITLGDGAEIVDLGSSNGIISGEVIVPRANLQNGDAVLLGDTLLQLTLYETAEGDHGAPSDFNRPPRVLQVFPGEKVEAPEPPPRFRRPRMPWIAMVAPILMGMVLFAATRSLVSILFVALSPLMALGNVIEGRFYGRKDHEAAVREFRQAVQDLGLRLEDLARQEVAARCIEHPDVNEIIEATEVRGPLLWARRRDLPGFLDVRFGLGSMPSRTTVELPRRNDSEPSNWQLLDDLADRFRLVHDVPVVTSLADVGNIGIAGDRERTLDAARAAVYHLVGLHSPAELVMCALGSVGLEPEWDWLKWVPHVTSDHSPIDADHLASSPGACQRVVAAIEDLVDGRSSAEGDGPAVVVLVENTCPVERNRLVALAENGPAVGVHLLWLAETEQELPAACRTFVVAAKTPERGSVGFVRDGFTVEDVHLDIVSPTTAYRIARVMSPVVDAGAGIDDQSDLPRSVSLLTLLGDDIVTPAAVMDRWRTSGSLPENGVWRGRAANLRAAVGVARGQEFVIDLREHGPHALVGGTTGSGKSEFLQSWVMAMAAEHSAQRLTFLFVDYKGGSAFGQCTDLPHSVGLVTDLSPHLVRRALTSLRAELRHREQILNRKAAKDLITLERRGDPDAPPSLVVVVDEFAALIGESPEFVEGVVDVAQRGRSLGLHLVLATQRPAGVIRENLRANTNLRIALRMADEADSDDVVGTKDAAVFDPGIPGRGIVKVGPGRLVAFQAGYVGGRTTSEPPPPVIDIDELRFGTGAGWEEPESVVEAGDGNESGPTDLQRLVHGISRAHGELQLPAPRRPWLDELEPLYELSELQQSHTDDFLVFALEDEPHLQRQSALAYRPEDGNLAVYGTSGSGKSTLLRTLAIEAALGEGRGGPCFVYALDFGARGLQMLDALPNVGAVIPGDDDERTIRLLRQLRDEVDHRAERFAEVKAGSINDYRSLANRAKEPRILLMVDNISAFRQAFESGLRAQWLDAFQAIASSGRPVGIHVIVTADRPSAIPAAVAASIPNRLVLRLADDGDYPTFGVPADAFRPDTPPGRGFWGTREFQVAVLGKTSNTVRQAKVVARLAGKLRESTKAPAVGRLPESVTLGELPVLAGGYPSIGISDETLSAVGVDTSLPYLVVGPPQSGKTSTLATIALSLSRSSPRHGLVLLTPRNSPLARLLPWTEKAEGVEAVDALALKLGERGPAGEELAVIIDDLPEFLNSDADQSLQDLLRACRARGTFVAASCEISQVNAYGPLMQAVKSAQHGVALRPDQGDGDSAFRTPFPRLSKTSFPPGRGLAARGGRAFTVQLAFPDMGG